MQPDPEKNASFFRNGPEESTDPDEGHDLVIEDFNSFFEKLSSLDDLQWSSDPDPSSETGETPPDGGVTAGMAKAVGESAPATKPDRKPGSVKQGKDGRAIAKRAKSKFTQVNQKRMQPKMEVVTSASVDAAATRSGSLPTPTAKFSSASQTAPDESFDTARAAKILKLALVSLILFGLGLGAGWAALSLPSRFDNLAPTVKKGKYREGMASQAAGMGTVTRWGEWIWSHGDSKGREGQERKTRMQTGAVPTSKEGAASEGLEQGTRKVVTVIPGAGAMQNPRDAKGTEAVDPAAGLLGARDSASVAQETIVDASKASLGDSEKGNSVGNEIQVGEYALQVGACSSFRCVESFRKLLLGQVNSGAIKVITQNAPEGGKVIQRIRIEPLERVEAERLKAALLAENPQFAGAYLVRAQ